MEEAGAGAGVMATAGTADRTTGDTVIVGAVAGAEEAAGTTTGATGAGLEAACVGADAAGSACSVGNTWIGGGGSAGGIVGGCCITAAKPNAATNSAMINHKEFLGLDLSSSSKAELVDF